MYERYETDLSWEYDDKIRITLFCKQDKNQIKNVHLIQNYPAIGYVADLKPGEQREVFFAGKFPNNCLESEDKYQIVLYSNCIGKGTEYKPCDNFGQESNKNPKELSMQEFSCKKEIE